MSANHTPAPWNREYVRRLLRFADKNPMTAGLDDDDLRDGTGTPDQDDTDLVTAAPDLLGVTIDALSHLGPMLGKCHPMTIAIKAAIAKATGKEGA